MKTIGLLGGMSWESTAHYYQLINEQTKNVLGGLHSAKILLYSFDFEPIAQLQRDNNWPAMADALVSKGLALENAGADCLAICTNTMHKLAPALTEQLKIPLLHIADATAQSLMEQGISKIGLLGTAFTMEESFYKDRLQTHFGIEVIIPDKEQRQLIHQVIYNELCLGITKESSKSAYLTIIESLAQRGAQGVILGCTEIGLLLNQTDTSIKLFDTTAIHAKALADFAIS